MYNNTLPSKASSCYTLFLVGKTLLHRELAIACIPVKGKTQLARPCDLLVTDKSFAWSRLLCGQAIQEACLEQRRRDLQGAVQVF